MTTMIDQPNDNNNDNESNPMIIASAKSAMPANSSELNLSDQKILVEVKPLTTNVNSIQKDGVGGYRFVKVRNRCR